MPTEIVATWPRGSFAENFAVGADGRIFVSLHTDRRIDVIDVIDPATDAMTIHARFEAPVAGIVLMGDGALYVGGGEPGKPSGRVWRVERDGAVSPCAALPDATFLNGMVLHPDGRTLLVADSIRGAVYAVDPCTGAHRVWLADSELLPDPAAPGTPGVNGIKVEGGLAYLSVTARDQVVRAPLGTDGEPGALVVKAVPPFAELLHAPAILVAGARPGVFVCADDPAARGLVAGLVEETGAEAVEAGPLALTRYTEPLGMLLVQLAYAQGFGPRIGARLLRENTDA